MSTLPPRIEKRPTFRRKRVVSNRRHLRRPTGGVGGAASSEAGQVSILMAVVVALGLVVAGALALMGSAMISRVRAAGAADAVALAHAADPTAGQAVAEWYRDRGMVVSVDPLADGMASATVNGDPGRARSWAETSTAEVTSSPALVAVIARAGQLIGTSLNPIAIDSSTVELSPTDTAAIEGVANELRLCRLATTATSTRWQIC